MKVECLGCDRRRIRIVRFRKPNGDTVEKFACAGMATTPCHKGHGV